MVQHLFIDGKDSAYFWKRQHFMEKTLEIMKRNLRIITIFAVEIIT